MNRVPGVYLLSMRELTDSGSPGILMYFLFILLYPKKLKINMSNLRS